MKKIGGIKVTPIQERNGCLIFLTIVFLDLLHAAGFIRSGVATGVEWGEKPKQPERSVSR